MLNIDALTLFPVRDKLPLVPFGELEAGQKIVYDDADVALRTGEQSGIIVLDCDDLNAALPGDVPDTFAQKTKKGFHVYLKWPGFKVPTLTDFPCEGWDIRGDTNGYVVLVGEGYEPLNDLPVADCPKWLIEKIAAYELERSQRPSLPYTPVDLDTPFGEKMRLAAIEDAKTLPVGEAGERDLYLFRAANQIVRGRGIHSSLAKIILLEHYCPRVPPESQDTVSLERVCWKCDEAERTGTTEFNPLTEADVAMLVEVSKSVAVKERAERFNLVAPSDIDTKPEVNTHYRPLRAKEMVPSGKLNKIGFASLCNVLATNEAWHGRLSFDEFAGEYLVFQPPVQMSGEGFFTEEDVTSVRLWFACALSLDVGADNMLRALCKVATDNKFHPLRDYLVGLKPVDDPYAVLQDFAVRGIGVSEQFVADYVRKFMVGAVRRVLNPGVKMDGVLVLKGEQNTGKSSLLYALSPAHRWVQEGLPDMESKDASEVLRGRWLVELDEFQAILRKSEAVVKGFLSRCEDSYRRPFARGSSRYPRQCVFIATTNEDEILRDPTGARRYWIVETPGVDLPWIEANRDAIWSAAVAIAVTNEQHQLTLDEIKRMAQDQKDYQATDPWQVRIAAYLEGKTFIKNVDDVYLNALHNFGHIAGLEADAIRGFDRKAQHRVADTMRRLGWARKKGRACGWHAPDTRPYAMDLGQ